jgi:hypothetical protein
MFYAHKTQGCALGYSLPPLQGGEPENTLCPSRPCPLSGQPVCERKEASGAKIPMMIRPGTSHARAAGPLVGRSGVPRVEGVAEAVESGNRRDFWILRRSERRKGFICIFDGFCAERS